MNLIKKVAELAVSALQDFFSHILVKKFSLSISVAGDDAADTAIKYGKYCAVVYPAVGTIVRVVKCKGYGVDINPNFSEKAETEINFDFAARIFAFRPIGSLMDTTMEKIKEMIDVNTIIGEPITSPDGTLIIPVSKVSYGFAAGGSDLPTKKENKDCFGGGSGAGVTIQPVAFLTVYQGDVRLVSVDREECTADKLVNMIPDVLKKVKGVFKKDKSESADDFSEITQDDIDG